jgi:hypothetical protein
MDTNSHREFLREVERDIATLTEKLRELRAVADYHSRKLGIAPATAGAISGVNSNGHAAEPIRTFAPDRFKRMSQREAAALIIREAGHALRAGDIARTMVEYGYPRPQKMGQLTNSLFTSMTRDTDRFVKIGPGQWDVKDK